MNEEATNDVHQLSEEEQKQKAYEEFVKNALGLGSDIVSIFARFNCTPQAAALAGSHVVVRSIDAVLSSGNKDEARNLARQVAAGLINACKERQIDLQPTQEEAEAQSAPVEETV